MLVRRLFLNVLVIASDGVPARKGIIQSVALGRALGQVGISYLYVCVAFERAPETRDGSTSWALEPGMVASELEHRVQGPLDILPVLVHTYLPKAG